MYLDQNQEPIPEGDCYIIELVDFDKISKPGVNVWHRAPNNIFYRHDTRDFTPSTFTLWHWTCCASAVHMSSTIRATAHQVSSTSRVRAVRLSSEFLKLAKLNLIRVLQIQKNLPTNRQTNTQTTPKITTTRARSVDGREGGIGKIEERYLRDEVTLRLEEICKHYPARQGPQNKTEAFAILRKELRTEEDFIDFEKAVKNYGGSLNPATIGTQYVMMFSTFAKEVWRDYVHWEFKQYEDPNKLPAYML